MIVFIVTNTVIAVAALILGVAVLRREWSNVAYQSFFIFVLGLSLSAAAKLFFQEDQNFLIFLLVWWGFELMALGVFSLVRASPDGEFNTLSAWSLVPWFLLFVSIPILLVAASFRADPDAFFWQTYHDILPLFAVFMVIHLVISFFSCLRHRVSTFGLPFYLVRGLLLIVVFSASIICAADLILPAFGIYQFSTASNLFALIILAFGGYSIARYGVGNGSVVLRRGVPYFLSLISVAIIFFGIEFSVEKFFYQNDEVVDIVAAVAGALAFCPVRSFFNKVTDSIFFRSPRHVLAITQELGERLSAASTQEALIVAIAEFVRSAIRPTEIVFFTVDKNNSRKVVLASGLAAKSAVAEDYSSLAALFLESKLTSMVIADILRLFYVDPIQKKESGEALIEERAARLGVGAVVPVISCGEIKMIIMVGHKCSGALLTTDDSELLGFAARRVATALENLALRELMDRQAEHFEERVTARTERLKSMYESQSKFLTDVSHEFKTPLAILKMYAGIFAESKDTERKKAWYVIDTTLDRLNRMVSDILDVTRKKSTGDGSCKKRIIIKDLLRETRDECAILAESKKIGLCLLGSDISVLGERDRLKEVFLNLLSNAMQHTPVGGSISLMAHETDNEAEIMVRDTGFGISQENLPHIFERFYRIGGDGFEGTGIGLYLCRQIIEEHGGTITAESQKGKGSCFVIRLPILPRDA
jgi:signal transduction histidine kinase